MAGDISDHLEIVEQVWKILTPTFHRVFFVPGNHDLWTDSEHEVCSLENEKKKRILFDHHLCDAMFWWKTTNVFAKISSGRARLAASSQRRLTNPMSLPPPFFLSLFFFVATPVLSCPALHTGLDQEVEGEHRPVQKVRCPHHTGARDGPGLGRAAARVVPTTPFNTSETDRKNGLFALFIYKNDHFTKTGSGQT